MLARLTPRSRALWITTLAFSLFAFAAPAPAALVRIFERFENIGSTEDPTRGWTIGGDEGIESIGSNHYFRGTIDTFGVSLRTKPTVSHPWVGARNYRTEGVVGFQLVTAGTADFNTIRPLTLALINTNGTPSDVSDDFGFYFLSNQNLRFDGRPRRFSFVIPSWVTGSTPPGWTEYRLGANSPPTFTWDEVITHVDQLRVEYFNPDNFYIFQFHTIAVDDIALVIDTDRR